MPPPPAAEPAMSGTTGSGAKGDCGPLGPAPPRRPRSRTGLARAAGEAERTRGARCATPLGTGAEKKSCVASTAPSGRPRSGGGGPAAVPPVDDDAARGCAAVARARSARRRQGRRGCRPRRWASRPAPARRGSNLSRRQDPHRRRTSSSTPSSSPRAERWPARVRHAPVQFHTQVQVSGAPGALTRARRGVGPGGARAVARRARLRASRALAAVAVTPPGALAPLGDAVTPGALRARRRRRSPRGWPRRRRTPSRPVPPPHRRRRSPPESRPPAAPAPRASSCAGAAWSVVAAAGVAAASWEAVAAGAEAPPSVDADVPGAAAAPPLAAAALLVLVWVTAPSSPGLSTRTETLTLAGPAWALPALALTPPAALAPALLACATVPFSPGLSTRTETFTLAGCACSATAAPVAAATAAEASSARAAGAMRKTTVATSAPSRALRRNRSWTPAIARFMPPSGARVPCNHR